MKMINYPYKIDLVSLHITQKCSHKCPFCYSSSSVNAPTPDFNVLVRVIRKLAENKVKEIAFLGGDPCRHPKLIDLAREAKKFDILTTVLSNTHSYNRSTEEVIEAIDCFETTFHGPSPTGHDLIALSSGAFNLVVKNLKEIADGGARSIGAVYNITPQNYKLLHRTFFKLIGIHKIPIDHLVLQRIVPLGRGRETSRFSIGRDHAIMALEQLETITKRYQDLNVFFEDPFPFCVIPKRFHRYLNRCEWGYTRASINSKGDLSRCGADPRYRLGNIFEKPFLQIWNESEILKNFRSKKYLPEKCQQCALLERCGGGCALSCEIDLDHGIDYMFLEGRRLTVEPPHTYEYMPARREDLSQILKMEWASFPDYEFKFTPHSIIKWFEYNPEMFYVLCDSGDNVIGYSTIVPLTEKGFKKLITGDICSLSEMEYEDVCKINKKTKYYHIEVLATIADVKSRSGHALIRNIGNLLTRANAEIITASPITIVGTKLCDYFEFEKVAKKHIPKENKVYDVYKMIVRENLLKKVMSY